MLIAFTMLLKLMTAAKRESVAAADARVKVMLSQVGGVLVCMCAGGGGVESV